VTMNCGLREGDCAGAMNLMRQSDGLRLVTETDWQGKPVQLFEMTSVHSGPPAPPRK
jgi:hypothetical protein